MIPAAITKIEGSENQGKSAIKSRKPRFFLREIAVTSKFKKKIKQMIEKKNV